MRWINGMSARLRGIIRRGAAERRAEEEIRFHLELEAERHVREGVPVAEARRRAAIAFGGSDRHLEALRDGRRIPVLETLARDARQGARSLRRSVGFTVVATATLALGIGAATAMFSVYNGVLLRDLPVHDQDRLVVLWAAAPARSSDRLPVLYRDVVDFGARTVTLESVAGVSYYGTSEKVVLAGRTPLTVGATWVTGDFFDVLGVAPVLGRTLRPSDDVPGAARTVVISHGLWQRHFGGDPAVLGRTVESDRQLYEVIGVLPRGFEYPRGAEAWFPVLLEFPATLDAEASPASIMVFELIGRLRAGHGPEQARSDLGAYLRAVDRERPVAVRGMEPVVTRLPELVAGDARATVWAASAAVALLLLIACVNVANLLLIRGSARTRELAIRGALGAGTRRLVGQLLTESAVLALLGGVLGAVLAFAAVDALLAFAPPELPRRELIEVDARALLFAAVITGGAALLAGLLPALHAAAAQPGAWLRGGGRAITGGRAGQGLRNGLVIGQVSLTLLVVVAAGLLVRSLVALQTVDMGFNDERLLVLQTALPSDVAPERPRHVLLQEAMVERVAALPQVTSAAAVPVRPFSGQGGWTAMYTGEGQPPELQATNPWVNFEVVGPEYFRTLEIPLYNGRDFTAADREDAPRVAVISAAVARHTWPGEEAIGRRIRLGPADGPGEWHTVVGVVGETRYRELVVAQPSLYLPIRQFGGPVPMGLAVRTRAEPAAVVPQIRSALGQVHPDLMLVGGGPMRELVAAPLAQPRFSTLLLGVFAAVALVLAVVGIYGALAATVRERTREIGIRLALGAQVGQVRALVLRQGMRLALLGCALGLAAALLGTRALQGMLFDVSVHDPLTFAAVAALMLGAAALACYVPARRATRVDPGTTLRTE